MSRTSGRNSLLNSYLSVSVAVIVILFLSVALAAPGQTARPVQRSVQPAVISGPQAGQKPPVHFGGIRNFWSGGFMTTSVAIGDLNGDGNEDVVVGSLCSTSDQHCNQQPGVVGVLMGSGDGNFYSVASYITDGFSSVFYSIPVAIRDVNGDGKPDLIVGNECQTLGGCGDQKGVLSVWLGNGDGTFQNPVDYYSAGGETLATVIGDLNGDGIPDIAATDLVAPSFGFDSEVSVLLGNGDGTFQPANGFDSGGRAPFSVAMGDLNGDGKADLAVVNAVSSSLSLLLGNGDGTFQAPVSYAAGVSSPYSVAVGDLNGDGKSDVVLGNACPPYDCEGTVSVWLGNGDGTMQAPVSYETSGRDAISIAIGDLNGDGHPELVVANYCKARGRCVGDGLVSVLTGNGDGTFQASVKYDTGGRGGFAVAIGDVNGDGRPDLVVTSLSNSRGTAGLVGVLLNDFMAKTTMMFTSSPNPSLVGQPVTFTATITSNPSIPDGEVVTFYNAKTTLGTGTTVNGVATLTTSFAKAKTYSIRASYAGDFYHRALSETLKQVVEQ